MACEIVGAMAIAIIAQSAAQTPMRSASRNNAGR
jgi:hypothetical protein